MVEGYPFERDFEKLVKIHVDSLHLVGGHLALLPRHLGSLHERQLFNFVLEDFKPFASACEADLIHCNKEASLENFLKLKQLLRLFRFGLFLDLI